MFTELLCGSAAGGTGTWGGGLVEGKGMLKGTEWVSSIMYSHLQLELERIGAPFACVTVEHGALCEGHVPFCVYQDNCVGPCAIMRGANTHC